MKRIQGSLRFACGLFALMAALPVQAEDFFVDSRAGDDHFDGRSTVVLPNHVGPVRTLQRGVGLASAGDRIILVPGGPPLQEEVVVNGLRRRGGIEQMPIVVEGNGVEMVGSAPVDELATRPLGGGVYRIQPDDGPIHGKDWLFVGGKSGARGGPSPAPGQFTVKDGWFVFRVEPRKSIFDYSFSISRLNCGFSIVRSNYWVVRNLTIRGYRLDGVRVYGPVEGVRFENCRFLDNGRAGVATYTNAEVAIADSVAQGNAQAGFVGRNLTRATLERVRLDGSPLAADLDRGSLARSIVGEPLPSSAPVVGMPLRAAPAPTPAATRATEPPPIAKPKKSSDDD